MPHIIFTIKKKLFHVFTCNIETRLAFRVNHMMVTLWTNTHQPTMEYRKYVWSFMVFYLITSMIWVYHFPFVLWLPISLHTFYLKLIFHLQEVMCSYARFLCVRIRCLMHEPIMTQDEHDYIYIYIYTIWNEFGLQQKPCDHWTFPQRLKFLR